MTGSAPPDQASQAPASYTLSDGSSVTLNLIRMLSAQVVVIGHLARGMGLLPGLQPPHAPYMQNVAVVIFFILSGFLIERGAQPDEPPGLHVPHVLH